MRYIPASLAVVIVLLATAASSTAQTITVFDTNGAQFGGNVSYGGHGVDWEMTADSRVLWSNVRFRASVGQGRWVNESATPSDPTVTRVGVSVINHGRFDPYVPIRPYGGVGISLYVPQGINIDPVLGLHGLAGLEAVGNQWSVGPEVQLDLPAHRYDPYSINPTDNWLHPTLRIGVFARRRL
jgi:hypothetical protein